MSISTIYKNKNNKIITPQQAQLADSYTELNFVDNQLKTKINIRNNEIFESIYYMFESEDLDDVLNNLNQEYEWYINLNKEIINGYIVWESRAVSDGDLTEDFDRIVYGVDDKVIAAFSYDADGLVIDGIKFFYMDGMLIIENGTTIGYLSDGDMIAFIFNATAIEEISTNTELFYKPYTYLERFIDEWQNSIVLNLMTPEMLSYYTNVLPLISNF